MSARHVVVIGAGFGGLASAAVLAARGIQVTVVEAADQPGGKAAEVSAEGMTFDTGPSLLTLPSVLAGIFSLAGESLDDHVTLRALDPAFRYLYPDGTDLAIHHELDQTIASVTATLGANAAAELTDFMRYAERIWDASAPHFVFREAPSAKLLVSLNPITLARSLASIDANRSMWKAITAQVTSAHVRDLLARYATYNGSDVRQAPATLNCIAHVELGLGGYGVEGGLHAAAAALADVAAARGATFLYGRRVTEITGPNRRVDGVRLDDGLVLSADAVVSNVDVAHLYGDLASGRGDAPTDAEPSMSAWTGVFASRGRAREMPHTVIFREGDYVEEFADIFDRGRLPVDPTIYACNQRTAHGRASGPHGDPLFCMINAPAVGLGGEDVDIERLRNVVRARLIEHGLLAPGDPLVWDRSPQGLASAYPGSRGSIYGPSSNSRWSAFKRARNRDGRCRGLYVASGSAHPGGGVPLCLLSGLAASRELMHDLGLRHEASSIASSVQAP